MEHSLLWGKWIEWEIRQNSQEETNFLRDAVTRAVGEISQERGKEEEEAGYGHGHRHGHGHERAYRNRAAGFLPQVPSPLCLPRVQPLGRQVRTYAHVEEGEDDIIFAASL